MLRKLATTIGIVALILSSIPGAVFAANEDVVELEFVDLPETVESFIDYSFTVRAVDALGDPVLDYTGTIEFSSSTDSNAELPGEYEFTAEDQGEKDFTESYYFTETGEQEITVVDKDNEELSTTVTITVTDDENPAPEAEAKITLTSPTAGSTTDSTITVRGSTTPGVNVRVLNGAEVLGNVDADAEGNFEYTTSVLADGSYEIQVETDSASSETISVIINTSAPGVDFFELSPEVVAPGANAELTVRLDGEAREVKAIINGTQATLTQDEVDSKLYTGNIVAPSTADSYSITLNIEDDLGNVSENVSFGATLTVDGDGSLGTTDDSNNDLSFTVPSQVTGVQAQGSDKRIDLSWLPATAAAGVKNYAIYYGVDPSNLGLKIETNDATASWYIPNLANGQTYYFQIFAIDNNGNRSDQGSLAISGTPQLVGSNSLHGSGEGQVIVDQTTGTGPGGLLALAASSLFGAKLIRRRQR